MDKSIEYCGSNENIDHLRNVLIPGTNFVIQDIIENKIPLGEKLPSFVVDNCLIKFEEINNGIFMYLKPVWYYHVYCRQYIPDITIIIKTKVLQLRTFCRGFVSESPIIFPPSLVVQGYQLRFNQYLTNLFLEIFQCV